MTPAPSVVPFTKASACGNDFLMINGTLAPPDISRFTQRICDRHNGVGADGVEWLFPASGADVEARLINADGSEAEISGNGTRCVAAYVCAEQGKESVAVLTGAGLKTCTLMGRKGHSYEFEIAMGAPEFIAELAIPTSFGEVRGAAVSMGNPHFVVFVNELWADWQAKAAEIQRNSYFKHGVNVELLVIQDRRNIKALFFERGVGETQSSGTGSSAAAVAAITSGYADSPVLVHAPGGTQLVRFENEVFLRGPAELIFRGEFLV
jgi:diaminopimelate epimerase